MNPSLLKPYSKKEHEKWMPTHKPHSPADVGIKVTASSIYVGFGFYADPSFDLEAVQDTLSDHNL